MIRIIGLLIVFILCWPAAGHAAVISGLYQTEVPVPDQSAASQKQAVTSALLQVLIKLTGDRQVQTRADAARLLENAEQYVQQYKFHKKPIIVNNQLTLNEQLYLWVSFNAGTLDKAMQNTNMPLWGTIRPLTLIWLTAQQDTNRKFIGLEDEQGFAAILDGLAQRRGIPLAYPLYDNTDRKIVKETDVAGSILDPIRQASQRYTPDVALIGDITSVSETSWGGRWTMLINNETVFWSATGATAEQVLQAGIDRLADELAIRFVNTVSSTSESHVEIEVKGIDNFDQYSNVLKYLQTLNSVVNVEVRAVEPGSVIYSITTTGGELAVVRAIELGKTLKSLGGSGSPYSLR